MFEKISITNIGWKYFTHATLFCLSQSRTVISHVICQFIFEFSECKGVVSVGFVDIGGIVDHHCLIFTFVVLYISL